MEPKHTPGPWEVKTDDFGIVYVANKDTILADNLFESDGGDLTPEELQTANADAALIAAAPDLLKALQTMLNLSGAANAAAHNLKAFEGLDVDYHTNKAREAIQKALN